MNIYGICPQIAFALKQLSTLPHIPPLIVCNLDTDEGKVQWQNRPFPSPQGYSIIQEADHCLIGGDACGCMYALIDIAEAIRGERPIPTGEVHPAILRRGIKLNIPLDARTPSYADASDIAWNTIPHIWEREYWHELLDFLALQKYNLVSIWSLHPFPSMVRTPGFERVALDDVMRTPKPVTGIALSAFGSMTERMRKTLVTVKKISMDEKIAFWQEIMQYAADRGIVFYVMTWNIFTYGTEDSGYGITDDPENPITKAYFKASVKALLDTYPLLGGIGVTAGERMSGHRKPVDDRLADIRWLAETYGAGIREALPEGRENFTFIHRQHMSDAEAILKEFKGLPVKFSMSFKHSQAHMYSSPAPAFGKSFYASLPEGVKTYLTIRNDDLYMQRWGGVDFAREYIRSMPLDKMEGFMLGPDGYTMGYDLVQKTAFRPNTAAEPAPSAKRLWIRRRGYAFAIWGRLAYQPDLPDQVFEDYLRLSLSVDRKTAHILFETGIASGRIVPRMNMAHWHDFDFQNYTEGNCSLDWKNCVGHIGRGLMFHDIHDYVLAPAQKGVGRLSVREAGELEWMGKPIPTDMVHPLESARQIEDDCNRTFTLLQTLPTLTGDALELAADYRGLALLGLHFAAKLRCAMEVQRVLLELPSGEAPRAIALAEEALQCWNAYARHIDAHYHPQHLGRLLGHFFHITDFCADAEKDRDSVRMMMEPYEKISIAK